MRRAVSNPVWELVKRAFDTTQISCTGQNALAVVPSPQVGFLAAQGSGVGDSGQENVNITAEGCTEVTLSWRFDFGHETSWTDPVMHIRVSVMTSDGTVLGQELPAEGSLVVIASEYQSYTVRAVSYVNGSECGDVEGSIGVQRFQKLYLAVPSILRFDESATITVSSSCPVNNGQLRVLLSHWPPGSLEMAATQIFIPQGQNQATVQITPTVSGCMEVGLTAVAAEHIPDSKMIEIYSAPEITNMLPNRVLANSTFQLQIDGNCFNPGETLVQATKIGEQPRDLAILNITSNSIECEGVNFSTGNWSVSIISRGLHSIVLYDFAVDAAPQLQLELGSFLVRLMDPPFNPCESNGVAVSWDVSNYARIVIKENGIDIHEHEATEGPDSQPNPFTRLINQPAIYRLDVYGVDGEMITPPEISVPENDSAVVPLLKSMRLLNNSGRILVIWKIEGWYADTTDIPQNQNNKLTLQEGDEATLSFDDCAQYTIVAIDKDMADNDSYDPEGNAIEIGSLWRWDRTFVGGENGEEVEYVL